MLDLQKKEMIPVNLSVYRNELKYYITYLDYLRIKKILSKFLKSDAHTKSSNGYWIRSLYFDTPDDKEYQEKINGNETRKKIRLRLYDVNQERIKLEIKNRYNVYMLKETTTVSRDEALRLINRDKSFLLRTGNSILNRVYYFMTEKYYIPVVIVDYIREAFISDFNNIRITFDHDITACSTNLDLFKKVLNSVPVFNNGLIVMEVKYNLFLPGWLKKILSLIDTASTDISKYCYSRECLYKNDFINVKLRNIIN
jgi:hypothetical protein